MGERRRRSKLALQYRRWMRRLILAATVLMAAYVMIRVPATSMARLYGGIAVLATYIIVRRIATAIAGQP